MQEREQKLTPQEIEDGLRRFFGSETFTPVYPNLVITEGVLWLCQQAASFWLLDCIFSYQLLPEVAREPFQVIDLVRQEGTHQALIEVGDGNENVLHRQEIGFTDFPLNKIRLYYTDGVVLLPQEY